MKEWHKLLFFLLSILFVLLIIYSCLLLYREPQIISIATLLVSFLSIMIVTTLSIRKTLHVHSKMIHEHQETLQHVVSHVEKLENHLKEQEICDPLLLPKITSRTAENAFHMTFRQQFPGFIPQLRTLVPDITPGEEHLCMMIKLNMTTWEIAKMLGIDVKSVHTSRARLKRKLRLNREATINDWIKNIHIKQ